MRCVSSQFIHNWYHPKLFHGLYGFIVFVLVKSNNCLNMMWLTCLIWLVVWNHGILWLSTYIYIYICIYIWEFHHPNIFQRGWRKTTNQLWISQKQLGSSFDPNWRTLSFFRGVQCGAPSYVSWFINPHNYSYLRTINHSYWSYLHQLSYLGGPTL